MELIDQILSQRNLKEAIKRDKFNKGPTEIDKRTIYEMDEYSKKYQAEIKHFIKAMKYRSQAVSQILKKIYAPK